MLLLVFFVEYVVGEILFELINYHYFMLYFALMVFVDALVCHFLLKFTGGWRTEVYAILSVASIFLHIFGAWVFQFELNDSLYVIGLWVVLISKIILLDKAAKDAGDYLYNFAIRIFRSLVLRNTDSATSAVKGIYQ